ncbi:hypothetical protein HF313_25235 [Massilia atriviolacea]|uniref:General stress protein n=1 Tax=Massilia atriviolacea TaxID=2495579 RepID=A0A430HN84_9BURK|nr:KGG domain-containing protein [Massilia atriviolacea]RSZ59016.1 hypothetical protein EJB06_11845 [Massilia atriviolacea]
MASNNQGNKQSGSPGKGTSNRGFASMDPERQREIASEGGKAAHQKGTAHEFTSEEARRAGSMSHGNRQAAQGGARSGALGDAGKDEGGNKQSAGSGSKAGGDKSR